MSDARTWRSTRNAAVLLLAACALPAGADRLVNMIPQNRSAERNQDSEPTLAIDPNDYSRMAGSAFTWDNLTQSPMTTNTAPIYVSSDGGATWTLAYIVPSQVGSGFPTGDITLSFGATLSGAPLHATSWLYGGTLSAAIPGFPVTVMRTPDFLDLVTLMSSPPLDKRGGNVDQPHTRASSAIGGAGTGEDKLFVGFNNGYACAAPGGRSSTLDVTQSAAAAVPSFTLDLIEARNTSCQDGFAQVPAPHLDGTVYAAFLSDWNGTPRLVVVRDDAWGASGSPFAALADPSDMVAGRYVTPALTVQAGTMGQQRLGASNIHLAVDPRNSDRVYVAWGDSNGANSETIHVARSTDRGQTWSPDLLTVTNAMNPEVAINALGTVGVLYQRVVANRWETHLTRTTDADATVFDDPGVLLANTDATQPANTILSQVYVGDYASLQAAGKNFFGMFSASNFPDTANFLPGVQFQRYADWATHTLYADAVHSVPVPLSIDPYFFEVDALTPDQDFYVRDWTNDATHADNGVEPSTNPVFYATSDVWNRRSTNPGTFTNDQPSNEDAGNGAGNIGDNWAFARVRRNAVGAATPVTAHFLVSKFGTGSNYVDATVGDPDVSFPDPDPVVMSDGGIGPWISAPYHWHLGAIAGNHLCLAVEIATAASPYIPPSLVGQTPGWPTTDLRIVNDNHKAQRNMHLSTTPGGAAGGGFVTDYAIVHNGALFVRDVPLRVGVSGVSKRYVRGATVRSVAADATGAQASAEPGGTLVLHHLQPGENRWVAVTLRTAGLPAGGSAYVTVDDLAGGAALNGFGVGVHAGTLASAIRDSLALYRGTGERLAVGFGARASTADDVAPRLDAAAYVAFVHRALVPHLESDLGKIGVLGAGTAPITPVSKDTAPITPVSRDTADPFGLGAALAAAAKGSSAATLAGSVTTLLNGVDAQLTMLQLDRGDPADVLQMVRWQKQLFRQQPKLAHLECAAGVVAASTEFLQGRATGHLTNRDYPGHLARVGACLREAAGPLGDLSSSDLATLEKEHRAYLLALAK